MHCTNCIAQRAIDDRALRHRACRSRRQPITVDAAAWPDTTSVLRRTAASITRLAGDRYVFLEFGDMVLDFGVRAKVAEVQKWLAAHAPT